MGGGRRSGRGQAIGRPGLGKIARGSGGPDLVHHADTGPGGQGEESAGRIGAAHCGMAVEAAGRWARPGDRGFVAEGSAGSLARDGEAALSAEGVDSNEGSLTTDYTDFADKKFYRRQ